MGHDVLTQADDSVTPVIFHFLYDGHGSARALVDPTGAILTSGDPQVFRYDAFGNRLDTNDAITSILYSGEQTDATGLQYLRARYYDPAVGRFNRLDPFAGDSQDPQSLHKYLYAHANPVMGIDPTGRFCLAGLMMGTGIASNLRNMSMEFYASVFDATTTVLDGMQSGMTSGQMFTSMMMNELMGFGAGVVIGKASSIVGSVWENGIGHGANRAALRETVTNWFDGISSTFRRAGFWRGKPDFPYPVRIYDSRMPGKMANSDIWKAVEFSETKMAAMIHEFQDECTLVWGMRPNEGGPDVISVNMRNGEVTFWDAKWSGSSSATMPNAGLKGDKMTRWRNFALEALRANVGQASQRHVEQAINFLNTGGVPQVRGIGFGTLSGQTWP